MTRLNASDEHNDCTESATGVEPKPKPSKGKGPVFDMVMGVVSLIITAVVIGVPAFVAGRDSEWFGVDLINGFVAFAGFIGVILLFVADLTQHWAKSEDAEWATNAKKGRNWFMISGHYCLFLSATAVVFGYVVSTWFPLPG